MSKASPAKQACICLIAVRAEDDCVKCVAKCKVTCKKARAVWSSTLCCDYTGFIWMGKGKRMQSAEIDPVGDWSWPSRHIKQKCRVSFLVLLLQYDQDIVWKQQMFSRVSYDTQATSCCSVTVHSRKEKHGNLVDSASSHTLVSKIKPCMSKYKSSTLKLRMAHYISYSLFDSPLLLG